MSLGGKIVGVVLFVILAAAVACVALLTWVMMNPVIIGHGNVDNTVLQMKKVGSDLDMYAAKHKGRYPTTAQGLAAASKYFVDNKVPTDAWGNPFLYFSPALNCQKAYELVSTGEDGELGGENFDADLSSCHPDGLPP